jgi:hypothetical protein
MPVATTLIALRHPNYSLMTEDWSLWRQVYEGGNTFINNHLQRFSKREGVEDFDNRKKLSYNPGFAASALDEVRNSIYGRMPDITRAGGSTSYQTAIEGKEGGVDLTGSSMNYFIGQKVLPEMLAMTRVGVFVDMPPVEGRTILDAQRQKVRPYLYHYAAEEVLNWTLDLTSSRNEYSNLLLEETYNTWDVKWNMPSGIDTRYRFMVKNAEGVFANFFDTSGNAIDMFGNAGDRVYQLNGMQRIPFVIFEIPHSILKNTAKYDVALLNIASSDVNFSVRANFPVYVEQEDSRGGNPHAQKDEGGGTTQSVAMGVMQGRAYGAGLHPPSFIHPSPDPLKASMEKQEQMKREIRLLTHLSVTNMSPTKQASAESKGLDNQGLEAGLAFIGMQLERGERLIAEYWADYEGLKQPATVTYPTTYSLKSDAERQGETDHLTEILPKIPSLMFQKEVAKQAARNTIGHRISKETLTKIEGEIDQAPFLVVDPLTTQTDVVNGVLSKEDCAKARCYPAETVNKANTEHAQRLAEIAKSQTSPGPGNQAAANGAARGVPDTGADPLAAAQEKTAASNSDTSRTSQGGARVRGVGK